MTSTRVRLAALGAAAFVTWLSLAGPLWPATASSHRKQPVAAVVTAWWTTANLGSGVAVPGTLLGASGKQLPVEGSNALPPVAGVSTAPVSSIAVAGIRWQLRPGATATALSLGVVGAPPPFVSVQACQATSSFTSVYGGGYADVPSYSCAHAVDGVVKGGKLTFAGIGKLASGSTLSIVLLPGPLDRLVVAPPSLRSVFVTAAPAPHPPARPPAQAPSRHDGSSGGGIGGGPPADGAPAPGPLPSIPAAPQTGAASAPPPVVAGGPGATAQPAALSEPLPSWRRWLAAAVIALEVAVFMATRRSVDRDANPGRGIGRFVSERGAPPVRL